MSTEQSFQILQMKIDAQTGYIFRPEHTPELKEGPYFFIKGSEAWRAQTAQFEAQGHALSDAQLICGPELAPLLFAHRIYHSDIVYVEGEALPVSARGARALSQRCAIDDARGTEAAQRWLTAFEQASAEELSLPAWVEPLAQRLTELLRRPARPREFSLQQILELREVDLQQKLNSMARYLTMAESSAPGALPHYRVRLTGLTALGVPTLGLRQIPVHLMSYAKQRLRGIAEIMLKEGLSTGHMLELVQDDLLFCFKLEDNKKGELTLHLESLEWM